MTSSFAADTFLAEITDLFSRLGDLHYGEDVSQMDHALHNRAWADNRPPRHRHRNQARADNRAARHNTHGGPTLDQIAPRALDRAGGTLDASPREDAVSSLKMLGHAWLVTALNPKSLTFFVAFLPQFLDKHGDFFTQMVIFETTFLVLAFLNAAGYALVAARARNLVKSPKAIGIFNKTGGTLLVGAGVATATLRSAP